MLIRWLWIGQLEKKWWMWSRMCNLVVVNMFGWMRLILGGVLDCMLHCLCYFKVYVQYWQLIWHDWMCALGLSHTIMTGCL